MQQFLVLEMGKKELNIFCINVCSQIYPHFTDVSCHLKHKLCLKPGFPCLPPLWQEIQKETLQLLRSALDSTDWTTLH